MALTITTYQICSADTPQTAELRGGSSVTWLFGRVSPGGQAAAKETAEAAGQIPADCHPEVHREGFWSRVDARAGQVDPVRLRREYAGIRGVQGRVMTWPAAGYGVVAAGGLGGEG